MGCETGEHLTLKGAFPAVLALGRFRQGRAALHQQLAAAERALVLDPNHADAWTNKGIAFLAVGRNREVLAACERALAVNPNSAGTWTNKGLTLANLNRYEEALTVYDRAITIDPTNPLFERNKALALRRLGRTPEAQAAVRRAKELDGSWRPSDPAAIHVTTACTELRGVGGSRPPLPAGVKAQIATLVRQRG